MFSLDLDKLIGDNCRRYERIQGQNNQHLKCMEALRGAAYFKESKTPIPFHMSRQCYASIAFHMYRFLLTHALRDLSFILNRLAQISLHT